jgi:hypothetical protein
MCQYCRRTYVFNRIISISKAFFTWRARLNDFTFQKLSSANNEDLSSRNNSATFTTSTSSAYLALFAENERLRQQLTENQHNQKGIKTGAAKSLMGSIFRSRRNILCRYFLDRWIQQVKSEQQILFHNQKSAALQVFLHCFCTQF